MKHKWIPLISVLLVIYGCYPLVIGDGMFVVKGQIINTSNTKQFCHLYLYSENRENLLDKREIKKDFSVDFVVASYDSKYDVAAICNEREIRSKVISYGQDIKAGEIYDFGNIAL